MEKNEKKESDTPELDSVFKSISSGMLTFPGKSKQAVASALYYARCCVKRDIENLKKKHAEELERLKNSFIKG